MGEEEEHRRANQFEAMFFVLIAAVILAGLIFVIL
jgi:hypothetical protein